jgi:hypothetical protein
LISDAVVSRFCDLGPLQDEHDPACRTPGGLFDFMARVYPGFRETEIVTVLSFRVFKP